MQIEQAAFRVGMRRQNPFTRYATGIHRAHRVGGIAGQQGRFAKTARHDPANGGQTFLARGGANLPCGLLQQLHGLLMFGAGVLWILAIIAARRILNVDI